MNSNANVIIANENPYTKSTKRLSAACPLSVNTTYYVVLVSSPDNNVQYKLQACALLHQLVYAYKFCTVHVCMFNKSEECI